MPAHRLVHDRTPCLPDHLFGVSGERVFLEQRGNLTYDTQALLDLHLDYTFRLTGVGIQVGLDVFNLFGVDALTSADELVNFGTFGTPFFRVLVSTVGSERLQNLKRTTESLTDSIFWFTTLDKICKDRFFRKVWHRAGKDGLYSLLGKLANRI